MIIINAYYTHRYIDAHDDGQALKYREQLDQQARPLFDKYADNDNAKPVVRKVKRVLR